MEHFVATVVKSWVYGFELNAYPPYPEIVHHRAEERNPDISTEEEEREIHIYAKQNQSLYAKAKQCKVECEVFAFTY